MKLRRRLQVGTLGALLLLTGGVEAGAPNPFIEVPWQDLEGETWSRERLDGKVVLVEFWATWCLPCTAQHPELRALHQEFRERGFEILAVSVDRGERRDLRSWLRRHPTPWPVFWDGRGFAGPLPRSFAVQQVPRSFLFDGRGRRIAEDLEPAALRAVLASLLGPLDPAGRAYP